MTAIPCGQKNNTSEMIQSQTVTPPFAAIDGTTFRLKTATTKSNTRSQRPRTRRKLGAWSVPAMPSALVILVAKTFSGSSVAGGADKRHAASRLRFCERGSDFFKYRQMLVDVRFRVLHGNGPLLIPPIRLGQHAAIDHGEPVLPPEVDVDFGPVAIILNFLGVQHQR